MLSIDDVKAWRQHFPILSETIHVANCSQSPLSDEGYQAANDYLNSLLTDGMNWPRWMEKIHTAKQEFAKLINADVGDIAVGTSVSELTSVLASCLSYQGSRNKVVLTGAEFPTIGHVWNAQRQQGAQIDYLPIKHQAIDSNDYEHLIDQQTLLASICDVYYYNGFKQDLTTIIPTIHAAGSWVYIDAYQGIGTHDIDVKALDIDFLSSGNQKYLLGVPGIAFLYVKPDLVEQLKPAFTGWFGQENPFAFDLKNSQYASNARRFENGTPPIMAAYIAEAGLKIINQVGPAAIQAWTDDMSKRCLEGAKARGLTILSPTDIRHKAPTTAIKLTSPYDAESALKKQGIIASARGDVIRIAPHFFTLAEEIDTVLDALVSIEQAS